MAAVVHRYHDGTKHHFHQFARSLGYLDWATQPDPFRSFAGSPRVPLHPAPGMATPVTPLSPVSPVAYDQLFAPHGAGAAPLTIDVIGDLLRHALGLSAWKRFSHSRWSLRVNPSSGNLHPTEAYLVTGPLAGLTDDGGVYHYAPERHELETRCVFAADGWRSACSERREPFRTFLVALTSIHWRESWKYGERAFRYCQHDLGHAIAAVRFAARLVGWRVRLQPFWSHRAIAALVGIDRSGDYADAEREEPGCLLVATSGELSPPQGHVSPALLDVAREGSWYGRANQLSEDRVEWPFIDEIACATEDAGRTITWSPGNGEAFARADGAVGAGDDTMRVVDARRVILWRRSALAFDGRSSTDLSRFERMLSRTLPGPYPPWDALWWPPRIHLAIFVHRVDGLEPGLYLLSRAATVLEKMKAHLRRDFLWQRASETLPLWRLAGGDCRRLAARLSCDQNIAADGFFSLGMIAEFDGSLETFGPSFYRHLFWESGFVGQVLYLEAEAAGARATGIGCFYDDPVHEVLGLEGHAFQSLYHFSVGVPVEDERLTSEPGYAWER